MKLLRFFVHGSANLLPILLKKEDSFAMEMIGSNNNSMSKGMGWRVALSILTFFGSVISITLWLFFYAENFSVYQNIAVIAVILLAFVAIMSATWASWGVKQAARRSEKRCGNDSKSV